MISIVHTADLHLDPDYAFFTYDKLEERRKDFLDAFDQLINICLEIKPDALLICGDFYDKILPRNDPRVHVVTKFKEFTSQVDTEVIMISGNHDTPKSRKEAKTAIDTLSVVPNVTIFDSKNEFQKKIIRKNGKTIGIYGKSFDGFHGAVNPTLNLPECSENLGIVMLHCSLKEMNPIYDDYSMYAPCSMPDFGGKKFKYVALGHFHGFQCKEKESIFCYPGSIEKYSFSEEKIDKGVVYLELEHNSTIDDIEFNKLNTRPMQTHEIQFSSNVMDINRHIIDNAPLLDENELLRLILRGNVFFDAYRNYKRHEIENNIGNQCFAIKIENELSILETGESYDYETLRVQRPKEEFRRYITEKIQYFKNEGNAELIELYEIVLEKGLKQLEILEEESV